MSTAGSDVDASTAAVDGALRHGDVAASSNSRGLSTEPEGEEFSHPNPTRSMAELRIKLNHAILPDEEKRLKEQHRKGKPDNSSAHVLMFLEMCACVCIY